MLIVKCHKISSRYNSALQVWHGLLVVHHAGAYVNICDRIDTAKVLDFDVLHPALTGKAPLLDILSCALDFIP